MLSGQLGQKEKVMDNNLAQQTMQSNQPVSSNSNGNKMILWLVMGLLATILIVGMVYWYLSSQQSKQMESSTISKSTQTEANLEKDLNLIEVPEVDANFAEVDKDLQSL